MATIKAPTPGVFYRRPDPDEPPFAEEGDEIAEGDVIGLVEVMKSFHEVKSKQGGKIGRFLVDDEGEVTAGQDLVEFEE